MHENSCRADALKAWCTILPFLHDRSPLLLCGLAVMCLGGEVFCGTSPPQMMTPSCSHLLVTMTLGICLWYDSSRSDNTLLVSLVVETNS